MLLQSYMQLLMTNSSACCYISPSPSSSLHLPPFAATKPSPSLPASSPIIHHSTSPSHGAQLLLAEEQQEASSPAAASLPAVPAARAPPRAPDASKRLPSFVERRLAAVQRPAAGEGRGAQQLPRVPAKGGGAAVGSLAAAQLRRPREPAGEEQEAVKMQQPQAGRPAGQASRREGR